MKTTAQLERLMAPASLRNAWLIKRACSPIWLSPISPSISALGTSAATESMATRSTAPERTRISTISSACSPVSGWDTSRLSTSTPSFLAYSTSSACSRSEEHTSELQSHHDLVCRLLLEKKKKKTKKKKKIKNKKKKE